MRFLPWLMLTLVAWAGCTHSGSEVSPIDAGAPPSATAAATVVARAASRASAWVDARPPGEMSGPPRPFKPAPPTAYSTAVLASKPVAYYRFEETDGAIVHSDVGGDSYDALIRGSVTRVPGVLGSAVHFSGSDGTIDAGRNFALSNKEFAFELWVRPAPRDKKAHRIFTSAAGAGSDGAYFLGWDGPSKALPEGSGLALSIWIDARGPTDVSDPPEPPASTWTHLFVQGGGPDLFFYTNGERSQSGQVDVGDHRPGAAKFFIGSDAFGKQVFEGDIDELAIYDHGIDDDAVIRAHYGAAAKH